jgi:hypothetical protein
VDKSIASPRETGILAGKYLYMGESWDKGE